MPPAAKKIIRLPITNIYCDSDYTGQIFVGRQQVPANVILDTGSSTLAVKPSTYNAAKDTNLKPTTLAQLVLYGTGGWAGPVVNTSLTLGAGANSVTLQKAPLAITDLRQKGNFAGVDGILGLAYNGLNNAYDFKTYFTKKNIKPGATYPWPFPGRSFKQFVTKFPAFAKANQASQVDVVPYFDELEQNGVVANKFAFYTLRSWIHLASQDKAAIAKDRLNQGWFVMGGGEEQADLYSGAFATVGVLHDVYYNTNLKAVQVDGSKAVAAKPLQPQYVPYAISNSIIDSGTSDLSLAGDVFDAILQSLNSLNPKFLALIKQALASRTGLPMAQLDLAGWPNINFILAGEKGDDVKLTCTPQTYWQVNFPAPGQAMFQISGPLGSGGTGEPPNQSILGLPLMNNYYTVFDRSADANGVIRFAKIK